MLNAGNNDDNGGSLCRPSTYEASPFWVSEALAGQTAFSSRVSQDIPQFLVTLLLVVVVVVVLLLHLPIHTFIYPL
jgi:hypothetical protein